MRVMHSQRQQRGEEGEPRRFPCSPFSLFMPVYYFNSLNCHLSFIFRAEEENFEEDVQKSIKG